MLDFGEFDKMIKINGKVDKSNTYNWFSGNISLLTVWWSSSVNKKTKYYHQIHYKCLVYPLFHLYILKGRGPQR